MAMRNRMMLPMTPASTSRHPSSSLAEPTAFLTRQATPDPVILASDQGVLKAWPLDGTGGAHDHGLFVRGRIVFGHREEDIGVNPATGGLRHPRPLHGPTGLRRRRSLPQRPPRPDTDSPGLGIVRRRGSSSGGGSRRTSAELAAHASWARSQCSYQTSLEQCIPSITGSTSGGADLAPDARGQVARRVARPIAAYANEAAVVPEIERPGAANHSRTEPGNSIGTTAMAREEGFGPSTGRFKGGRVASYTTPECARGEGFEPPTAGSGPDVLPITPSANVLSLSVEMAGIEPTTPCPPDRCATPAPHLVGVPSSH